jgi:cytochrome-b5 reductase
LISHRKRRSNAASNFQDPKNVVNLPIGQHVTIKATVIGKTVDRSYDLISNHPDTGFLVLVKVSLDCQLPRVFFANLIGEAEVLFRGTKDAYIHTLSQYGKVCVAADSTGTAPIYRLIRAFHKA